jgi:hypothetical protein
LHRTTARKRHKTKMMSIMPWSRTSSALIERVPKCLQLIERTIAGETSSDNPESSTNVIVLDDASPRYMKAAVAVQACNVNLGIALRSLLEAEDNDRSATGQPALSDIGT